MRNLFITMVLVSMLFIPSLITAEKAVLVTDDFTNTKVPADEYFEKWIEEYVHWLLVGDEEDQFEELQTVEDKLKFIELFWLKRDPVLETVVNEFKEIYYQRLRYIYANFGVSDTPGILTHRGMVMAILGEPDYEDPTFSFSSRQTRVLRKGQILSRRGLLWSYSKQPGTRIPSYYYILFMRLGANRYEIVIDGYANVTMKDSYLNSGQIGSKGFIPARLLEILDSKKHWYVKNDKITLNDLKGKSGINFETRKAEAKLVEAKDGKNWAKLLCRIPYTDLIFVSGDSKNNIKLEGSVTIQNNKTTEIWKMKIDPVILSLTDEELTEKFEDYLVISKLIPKKPENSGAYSITVELKDEISEVTYSSKLTIKVN